MSSPRTREERAHSLRTVVVASAAAAIAAVVTSFFWRSGTPIAAAVTPVIVAVVSELLYHPTAKITERMTSEGSALSGSPTAGTQRSPSEARLEQLGRTGTAEPPGPASEAPPGPETAETKIYDSEARQRRGKVHLRFVLVVTLIAFVIAAAVITLPELLGGESIGSSGHKTTLFGGGKSPKGDDGADDEKPAKTDDEQDKTEKSGGEGKDSTSKAAPEQPKAQPAPKPQQQQGTSTGSTQTDTGSTSTTPK